MSSIFLARVQRLISFSLCDRVMNILVMLKPHEAMALVVSSEARNEARSMFLRSARNAIGHAAVKNTRSAGNDIDEIMVVAFAHR